MPRPIWDLPLKPAGIELELDNRDRVRIRPIQAGDRDAILAAFERFGAESRYLRFFGPRPVLGEALTERFSNVDDRTQLAWAVFDPSRPSEVGDDSGLVVGSARLFVDAEDPSIAEATLAIVDEYQGRGLGRFLMDLLLATAADHGFSTIRYEVLHENTAMRSILKKLGATSHRLPGDAGVLHYHLDVPSLPESDLPAGALYQLLRRVMNQKVG